MSDDLRERQPNRDQADLPPADGVRSDYGGSSEGSAPVAPGGAAVDRADARIGGERESREQPADPLADVKHRTADE